MASPKQALDDLAGMAGGALSMLAGLKAEATALAKSRADAFAQRMELVRREEFDAVMELARRARDHGEALEDRIRSLEARLNRLENPEPRILLAGGTSSTEA